MNRKTKRLVFTVLLPVAVIAGLFLLRIVTITAMHKRSASAGILTPAEVERIDRLATWFGSQEFRAAAEPAGKDMVMIACFVQPSETSAQLFEFPRVFQIAAFIDGEKAASGNVHVLPDTSMPTQLCAFGISQIDGKPIRGKHRARVHVKVGIGTTDPWTPRAEFTSRFVEFSM
jgi:hypothetical protein